MSPQELVRLVLVQALQNEDQEVQLWAAEALLRLGIGTPEATETLLHFLKHSNREVAAKAAQGLQYAGSEVVPALILSLEQGVQEFVLTALTHLGTQVKPAVPAVLPFLQVPDEAIRCAAITVLGHIGKGVPEVVPSLMPLLDSPESRIRHSAMLALARLGSEGRGVVPFLIEAFGHDDESLHKGAAYAVQLMGTDAYEAFPALTQLLRQKYHHNRRHAVWAFEAIGAPAVPALAGALQDANSDVRASVLFLFSKWGEEAREAVPAMIRTLHDPVPRIRRRAAEALREMGTSAREAAPTLYTLLFQTLTDPDYPPLYPHEDSAQDLLSTFDERAVLDNDPVGITPSLAASALRSIAPDLLFPAESQGGSDPTMQGNVSSAPGHVVIRLLIDALADPRKRVRHEAADALQYFGHHASEAVPALIRQLDDEEDMCRRSAARTLQYVCPEASRILPALIKRLYQEGYREPMSPVRHDPPIRISPFSQDHDDAADFVYRPYLSEAVWDNDGILRGLISPLAITMAHFGPASLRFLRPMLRHPWRYIQWNAVGALALMGQAAAPLVPALLRLLAELPEGADLIRLILIALRRSGVRPPDALPLVIRALNSPDLRTCWYAVALIKDWGEEAASAVPALARVAQSEVEDLQKAVIEALGCMGREAVPVLIDLLQTPQDWNAVEALQEIGSVAVPSLQEAMKTNPAIREYVLAVYAGMETEMSEVVPTILSALEDEDSEVREQAVKALRACEGLTARAVAALGAALRDKSSRVRGNAMDQLVNLIHQEYYRQTFALQ